MAFDLIRTRDKLHDFDFTALFVEELGWSLPASRRPFDLACGVETYELRHVAELAGVVVLEVRSPGGKIPDAKTRATVQREITRQFHENVLIFVDAEHAQSLWYWTKRDGSKQFPREHLYVKGQPGDLFLSKISAMFVDISELDEQGNIPIVDVARRLQQALDVEPVTKKFYTQYRDERLRFVDLIEGIGDEYDRRWYASVLLNRLMFIYFLQRKGLIDGGDLRYLQRKLDESRARGPDRYYSEFLKVLFFEGFAKPDSERSAATRSLLGTIKYLNGGLFLEHQIEARWPAIAVPDVAFESLLALFASYSWNLDDTPGGNDDELNPDVLGYIFEKYINQKAFGAYYTRTEITEYLCEQTIYRLILDKVNTPAIPGVVPARHFESVPELLMSLDAGLCRTLLLDVLPRLSLLDPACGSGAFLVAAMKTLIGVYSAVTGKIEYLRDPTLSAWLHKARTEHPSLGYYIKKRIITDNLFGVDIMEEATEIARLRLFLTLVSSAETVDQLEPLPNIDFNILAGNSLIGLLRVDEAAYNAHGTTLAMFGKSYRELVDEKNRQVRQYRDAVEYAEDLQALRDDIDRHRAEASDHLDQLLLDEFKRLGIQYEQATWDAAKGKDGRPKRRALRIEDIQALRPFHWGYEFDEVLNQRGGFDAILTNPPWETFKPQAKEFFAEYSSLVTTNKMTIKEFEREQVQLQRLARGLMVPSSLVHEALL